MTSLDFIKGRVLTGLSASESEWEAQFNEKNPGLIAKERYIACKFDGVNYVLNNFLKSEKAGAAAFFWTVEEKVTEIVESQEEDKEAMGAQAQKAEEERQIQLVRAQLLLFAAPPPQRASLRECRQQV